MTFEIFEVLEPLFEFGADGGTGGEEIPAAGGADVAGGESLEELLGLGATDLSPAMLEQMTANEMLQHPGMEGVLDQQNLSQAEVQYYMQNYSQQELAAMAAQNGSQAATASAALLAARLWIHLWKKNKPRGGGKGGSGGKSGQKSPPWVTNG